MSNFDNISQYYNHYDETKHYTEMMYRAGKVLQSKEMNEMQSMIKNQIKRVGDALLNNGDIIEGCQLIVNPTSVIVTKGKIYIDGNVRDFEDSTVSITGEGIETIGAVIKQEVVSPEIDEDLYDCATGFDNYGKDGAYRLKETVEFRVNDPSASTVYTLVDGELLNNIVVDSDSVFLSKINNTLARRTFDESGNYKVDGLTLEDKKESDAENIYVSLSKGKAYVKGYEVQKLSASTIKINRPNTVRLVANEPKQYYTNQTEYILNNPYVNEVVELVGCIQVTQNITRGAVVGGIDYLPLSPVVKVISVTQGSVVYTQGTDFRVQFDGIDWSIGTRAPSPGASYTVTWQYNKTMVEGLDFELINSGDISKIKMLSGDRPVNDTTMLVTYEFKLCRRDVIGLDKNGMIIVTQGQPDIMRLVESPSADTNETLVLGSVLVKPNTNSVGIINNNTKAIPMLDLYKMLDRISTLEYNQAVSDLDKEASDGEPATELIGVFTDGFIGTTKSDCFHAQWDANIDLDNQELTIPYTTTIKRLTLDEMSGNSVGMFQRLITAPYVEKVLLSQDTATNYNLVNSYGAFPKNPTVAISPATDNWIEKLEYVENGAPVDVTTTLRRWWKHKGDSWAESEKAIWESYGLADGGESLDWSNYTSSKTVETVTSVISKTISYMRENTISVAIKNLEPNVDNIRGVFDNKEIQFSADATYTGTASGTLKADSKGEAYGTFVIPAGTLCGTRELAVFAETTPSLVGKTNYTSNGTIQTTNIKVYEERLTVNTTDPLAQSFQFDTDRMITGIGVYFKDKDQTEPITIQVRNMVNGYPGNTILAEKTIRPVDVKNSTDATKETTVKFDNPVYCESGTQYCFTILSNSVTDSVWYSESNGRDVTTGIQVIKNPYLDGVMFSSSNALTWTAHQGSDLKFKVYGAEFARTGVATFEGVEDVSLNRLMVVAEESIPSGCSITWKYSINGGAYLPIETYDERTLDTVGRRVSVQMTMTSNTLVSPAIAIDSIILAGFTNKMEGTYISKNVEVADGFNQVKIVLDVSTLGPTNFNIYFATDKNGNVWQTLDNTDTKQKSNKYTTYTFEKTLSGTANNYRVKIVLSTTNTNSIPTVQNLKSIMKTV